MGKSIKPLISKDLANVFLRDLHKRKSEGKPALEKYSCELAEQIVEGEPNLYCILNELTRILPEDEEGIVLSFAVCYDLFRRKIEREYLEG